MAIRSLLSCLGEGHGHACLHRACDLACCKDISRTGRATCRGGTVSLALALMVAVGVGWELTVSPKEKSSNRYTLIKKLMTILMLVAKVLTMLSVSRITKLATIRDTDNIVKTFATSISIVISF